MLCLIGEFAMTIFGIVTLVRGRFQVSGQRTVVGTPARIIGVLLAATLPVIFLIGFVAGVLLTVKRAQEGLPPPGINDMQGFMLIDPAAVGIIILLVSIIALTAKPQEQMRAEAMPSYMPPPGFPPADPNNPYSPPYASGQPSASPPASQAPGQWQPPQ